MKIKPTGDLVLVKPIAPQAQPSAILRADAFQQDKTQGVVMAVGDGRITRKGVRIAPEVSIGQIVYLGPNPQAVQEIRQNGEMYILIPENHILGILSA